jgi:hypothetical protein
MLDFRDGKSVKRKTIQKGLREQLLCEACEAAINVYERQFKEYWYDLPALPETMDFTYKGVRMSGANFAVTKLFHLSVLWRAGVSSLFPKVTLGPYEQKLAKMLLAGDPGKPDCFPVIGVVLVDDEGKVVHIISEPVHSKFHHSHAYYMCYAGCEWYFIVTDHPEPTEARLAGAITPNGDIFLPYVHWTKANSIKAMQRRSRRQRCSS